MSSQKLTQILENILKKDWQQIPENSSIEDMLTTISSVEDMFAYNLIIGLNALKNRNIQQSEAIVNKCNLLLSEDNDIIPQRYKGILDLLRGSVKFDIAEYHQSIEFYESALTYLKDDAVYVIADIFTKLAQSFSPLGMHDKSEYYFNKALGEYKTIDDKLGIAYVYHYLGVLKTTIQDNVGAMEYLQESLRYFKDLNHNSGITSTLGNIGVVYINVGDYERAIDNFRQILTIFENNGENIGMGITLINIGNLFANMNDKERAYEYRVKALNVFHGTQYHNELAACHINLGSSQEEYKKYDDALLSYQDGLQLYTSADNKNGICTALIHISKLYLHTEKYDKSESEVANALEIAQSINNKEVFVEAQMILGEIYLHPSKYNLAKSEEHGLDALRVAISTKLKQKEFEAHLLLARIYELGERWKEANEHIKQHYLLKEQVQSSSAEDKIRSMDYLRKIDEAEKKQAIELARLQEKEQLLYDLLPKSIAERILVGEKNIADTKENVSILFCDIVGFTSISSRLSAEEVVTTLNTFYSLLDSMVLEYRVEKIKTIGDAYVVACGLNDDTENHKERILDFSLELIRLTKKISFSDSSPLKVRVGIHSGQVVAGVIGSKNFSYDIWGDTVNLAARMESLGESDKIHIAYDFIDHEYLRSKHLQIEERRNIEVKGKGTMSTILIQLV